MSWSKSSDLIADGLQASGIDPLTTEDGKCADLVMTKKGTTTKQQPRERLRRKLEDARSALKVIHTWASFQDGRTLNCKDVIRLTRRVLDDTEPNEKGQP
jgi:hypothetical protein